MESQSSGGSERPDQLLKKVNNKTGYAWSVSWGPVVSDFLTIIQANIYYLIISTCVNTHTYPVSYTHLDVYKRQGLL